MSFNKKTIHDIDLHNKTVLVRADYNVPISGEGKIADDYRIKQSLPTIQYLLDQNCKVIICSHLGRPTGPHDKHCTLKPVAERLSHLLDRHVKFSGDCIGPEVEKAAEELEHGQVLLLENLRYHAEEEKNDHEFAKSLAKLAEVFVQDGFGVVHRAHASTEAVTHYIPSVGGLLLAKEVGTITDAIHDPKRPLMAIIGGAKIADKIDILNRFIDIADFVAVGGAMANTFLLAKGIDTGKSLTEPDDIGLAKDIMEKAAERAKKDHFIFYLPQDAVVATSMDKKAHTRVVDWEAHTFADVDNYPKRPPREASKIAKDEMILDIGPFSGSFIAGGMQLAGTVIWNGTMGVTEVDPVRGLGPVGPFAHGTELLIEAMLGKFGHRPFSVVGGGDTVGYVENRKLVEAFDHVSTGGGASLELMSGKKLPGVEALQGKD